MPTNSKSPYATSFNSAIKKGTPAGVAVASIAKRTGKAPSVIFNSLYNAELCDRQKFNGQWLYWALEGKRGPATVARNCQNEMWQSFIDWCVVSGQCTPEVLSRNLGSQQSFMTYCRKFFNRQLKGSTAASGKSGRKSSASYKFPKTSTRRYRRAA